MALLKRIRRLISANLNDLIDQCEDPEKMLRQAVRDMETALGQIMDAAARAIAHHKLLSRQLCEAREAIALATKQAEAAVARGDDDAARRELVRKSESQRLADALSHQADATDALGQRLRRQVSVMRIKLAEARQKLVDITARKRAAAAQRQFVEHLPDGAIAGRVCSTFDTLCAKVEQSEAETEALIELLDGPDASAPLEAEIEAELRALKEVAKHVAT
jgi:phage shock protein A